MEAGLFRRLFARAHQSGRPGTHAHDASSRWCPGDVGRTLEIVAALYDSVVDAGVHRASSIKVAEAAKVIENTQRDLNIALMNELALIFDKIGIDTARSARGGRHQVELPAVSARAWSAGIASASTRTT